jgi:hypothetical protein
LNKYYGFTIPEEELSCEGCRTAACTLDPHCLIRPCAVEKKVAHCAECAELETCEKLKTRADITDELLRKAGNSISAEDRELFFTPYDGRKTLDELKKRGER